MFVYTIKDGDGDLSTTTLTINLANVTLLAPTDNDVTGERERAGHDGRPAPTLRHGTVTGSLCTGSTSGDGCDDISSTVRAASAR